MLDLDSLVIPGAIIIGGLLLVGAMPLLRAIIAKFLDD